MHVILPGVGSGQRTWKVPVEPAGNHDSSLTPAFVAFTAQVQRTSNRESNRGTASPNAFGVENSSLIQFSAMFLGHP